MYYVRKLNSVGNLFKIQENEDINIIDADIIGQEARTRDNTLSLWKCEDLKEASDTIKAIILSGNKIKVTQLIFIKDTLFEKFNIKLANTEGITAYDGFSNLHSDVIELTYEGIRMFMELLKDAARNQENLLKLDKNDIKQYISEVASADKINLNAINKELRVDLIKYGILLSSDEV